MTPTSGAAASVQDDPIAKVIDQLTFRAVTAEEMVRLKDEQLKAKDERIVALTERLGVKDEIIATLKSIDTKSTAVISGDARMLERCEMQLSRADAEINRLRNPSFFSRLFKPDTLTAGALGFGAGRLSR